VTRGGRLDLLRAAYREARERFNRGDVVMGECALRTAEELDGAPVGLSTTPSGRYARPALARELWYEAIRAGGAS